MQAIERVLPTSDAQLMLSYAPLVKKTAPAVVNIYTAKEVAVHVSPFLNDPFFQQFFGGGNVFGERFGGTRKKVVNSLGSGVIVRADGLVITNHHVVKGADEITLILADKREFAASIVLVDPKTDLALLKIEQKGLSLPYLEPGDVDILEVGDIVLAIGNPFGVGQTVTSGIVSALARTAVGVSDYEFFIQTDAAINPGNSGGALVNMRGELVGINTAIFTKTGGSHGIGFATPATMAKVIINSYLHGSDTVIRPWLGAATQNVTNDIAESLGMERPTGVLINQIYSKSAAETAGLQVGDVIMRINHYDVTDEQSLRFRVATYPVGSTVTLSILRDGENKTLSIEMERPREFPPRQTTMLESHHPITGAIVENLSPALAEEIGTSEHKGVIIRSMVPDALAKRFFKTGDIILSVNGVDVESVDHLQTLLDTPKRGWKISAQRRGQVISINIQL